MIENVRRSRGNVIFQRRPSKPGTTQNDCISRKTFRQQTTNDYYYTCRAHFFFLDIAARGRLARCPRAANMPQPAEFQRPRVAQRTPAASFGRRLFRDANPGRTAVGSPGLRARQGKRGPRPVRGREDR